MKARVSIAALMLAAFITASARAQIFDKRPHLVVVGHNPSAIAAQDLNDDGLPDIITADRGALDDPHEERPANDELSLLIAKGDLNYTKRQPSLKTDFGPYAIAVANIDALKWPDIIVANFHAARHQNISLFLNLHAEDVYKAVSFHVPEEGLPYLRHRDGDGQPLFTSPGLTSIVVRDFNGDSLRDLVATAWSCDRLVYMPGDAQAYFGAPVFIEAPGGPCHLAAGQLDGKGGLDLAVAMQVTNEIAIFTGDGAGHFEELTRFPSRGRLPCRVVVADVNGDKIPDIVVAHRYTDNLVIFYGDGGAKYSVSQEIMLGDSRGTAEREIRDLIVDDFNGDGRLDLAAASFAASEVNVLVNTSSDHAKAQTFKTESYTFDNGRPRALCTADFNKDGALDLAVALWDADAVALLINRNK